MARIVFEEKERVVPDGEVRGQELMDALGVSPGHNLIVIRPDGNRQVHRNDKVRLLDGDYFMDAPTFEFGSAAGRLSRGGERNEPHTGAEGLSGSAAAGPPLWCSGL